MRVSIYGAGGVGRAVAAILARRRGYDVLGPFSRAEREVALRSGADVVLVATTSFLGEIAEDLREAVEAGSNVITTAEEAAFPWHFDEQLASELDALARARKVTILGAGLNPGFVFDALVLTASGVVATVDAIRVERVVDLSGFSTAILRRLGIGFGPADFAAGVAAGTITGHIGFPQSMRIVARALRLELERVERHIEAIEAEAEHRLAGFIVRPGESAGFRQRYVGVVGGRPWFEALFLGHVDPEGAGLQTRDEISITGDGPPLRLAVEPGINPQAGAPSVIANSLERLVAAEPGWRTVADLPPAHPTA
jgi:hypothetical protein